MKIKDKEISDEKIKERAAFYEKSLPEFQDDMSTSAIKEHFNTLIADTKMAVDSCKNGMHEKDLEYSCESSAYIDGEHTVRVVMSDNDAMSVYPGGEDVGWTDIAPTMQQS